MGTTSKGTIPSTIKEGGFTIANIKRNLRTITIKKYVVE
jgi:hypothetical protein